MNQCENNPTLVKKLSELYQQDEQEKDDKRYAIYHEIISRYDDIKLVLFSLNNCVRTNIKIGNKRKINLNKLIEEVNKLWKQGDVVLKSEHKNHPDFMYIINTISSEVLGEEYRYNLDRDSSYLNDYLIWKDETIAEFWFYNKPFFISLQLFIIVLSVSIGIIISLIHNSTHDLIYVYTFIIFMIMNWLTCKDYKFSKTIRDI